MSEYGVFSDVVATAGAVIGAATAISLAWMRRSKWLPPEEDLPGSTRKVSALGVGIVIAILYVFGRALGAAALALIAGAGLLFAIAALLTSVYLNTAYVYEKERRIGSKTERTRVLGGFQLTAEAAEIQKKKGLSVQGLFENSHYDADLVWTRTSRGLLKVLSTAGYLILQSTGSIGLSAAALLVSLFPPSLQGAT